MNSWNITHREIGDFFWLTINNINHLDVADKQNAGGRTVTWQRHRDQIKLKWELHAPSVCETSFSAGSLRSIHLEEIIGKQSMRGQNILPKSNEQTTSFLSLLCIAISLPVYKSFLFPTSFSVLDGRMDFCFSLLLFLCFLVFYYSQYLAYLLFFRPNFYTSHS